MSSEHLNSNHYHRHHNIFKHTCIHIHICSARYHNRYDRNDSGCLYNPLPLAIIQDIAVFGDFPDCNIDGGCALLFEDNG